MATVGLGLGSQVLNTWLWHADTKTAAEFGNDPPEVLLMMSHAAETEPSLRCGSFVG